MTAPQQSVNFISDLEVEKNTLQAFIEILKKEENALIEGKIEEIDHLASDKSRLVDKLIQLDDHRNEFPQVQELTLRKNHTSTEVTEQHSGQSRIQILWNELLELAKIAQLLNHSNGLIISTYLQHNQRAFTALHCAAGNVSLYGPKGQTYI